jgi:hypothetical protein
MKPRKDFFIDYHPVDRPWAEWSAWHLEHAGYVVVVPAWDFRPGANVVQEIQRATVVAQHTIAILSPEYLAALNTQPAWAAAFAADLLVPVRVRPCEPSGLLRPIVYIDLVGQEEPAAKEVLLAGVGRALRPRPTVQVAAARPGSAPPPFPRSITMHVELTIDRPFADYAPDEQARLLCAIDVFLDLDGNVTITRKRPGSVKLTLALSPEQVARLRYAVQLGQFAEHNVVDVAVCTPPSAATTAPAAEPPRSSGAAAALAKGRLWQLIHAGADQPAGHECQAYLRRLDRGGQDWPEFFQATDGVAYRVAQEFPDLIPAVLARDDLCNESRMHIYSTWLPDYLSRELPKGQEPARKAPRSFAFFLQDRLRDYLRTIRLREARRRQLLAEQVRTLPRSATGPSLWSASLTSPEALTFLREIEATLPAHLAQIVSLVRSGWTYKEIADLQQVSAATISRHAAQIRVLFT